MIDQQQVPTKRKGVADVVFCLDRSGSMTPCLEGVKEHISKFIEGLLANPQLSNLYCRLGFIAYDCYDFYLMDFTTDIKKFQSAMSSLQPGGNEYSLPALDWSLDFSWRENAHRIVIQFTDEPLEGGEDPPFQRSKLQELYGKIASLNAMLYFVGPDCKEYRGFERVPKCIVQYITGHNHFYNIDFKEVLFQIGKTLSHSVTPSPTKMGSVKKDLYGMAGKINMINL